MGTLIILHLYCQKELPLQLLIISAFLPPLFSLQYTLDNKKPCARQGFSSHKWDSKFFCIQGAEQEILKCGFCTIIKELTEAIAK